MKIKIKSAILCMMLFMSSTLFAQVGVGTNSPNSSAQLEVSSTSKGFLPPRMTMVQRDAISSPATGLIIYQTDNMPGLYYYNGISWSAIGTGLGNLYDAGNQLLGSVITITTTNVIVRSPKGYYFTINWTGLFPDQQIYYGTAGCTGTMWLNAGTTTATNRLGTFLVYEGKTGNFHVPASVNASTGLATNVAFSAPSLWNSSGGVWQCLAGGSNGGWLLTPISRTDAGVPATITAPLTIR